ncbi:MAG: DUF2384 domain-containing protein [Verrucomicrobiota bacterium JB022]|nr:DUF2384 domain-containing protein [Verrucomicrobiota bacterium JB022]
MSAIQELVELSPKEQINLIRAGISTAVFDAVAETYGLSREAFADKLGLSIRTVNRKKKDGAHLGHVESERVLRAARLHHLARILYATDEAAGAWLSEPTPAFGGAAMLELVDTDIGYDQVHGYVLGLAHGVFQ